MQLKLIGSVVKQVESIIQEAISAGVSDIHLEPYEKRYRLRYRLDGVLQEIADLQLNQKDAIVSRIKIMAGLDIAEKRRPQDGRIIVRAKNEHEVDLRVSTLPTHHGEKIVLRILDKSQLQLSLEALGFDANLLVDFRKAIHNPYGMILVTGPTGSGKSTSLYAALNELNSPELNITTIEDPIEYNLEGINQTQIHEEIGLTFSAVLRSILRQDPNIIMVGEIRDKETAAIAIRSALTGHLVFSTLHTNDAVSAISRLVDMGIDPFLIASSIRLIMAQRLVRKICKNCLVKYEPAPQMLKELGLNMDEHTYMKGAGCDSCNYTGYKGRTALIEIITVNEVLSNKITKLADASEFRKFAQQSGMVSLREAGLKKIINYTTTIEEIYRETVF